MPSPTRAYQRYAWVLVFIPAFILFVLPIPMGFLSSSPAPNDITSTTGMTLIQIGAQNQGTAWLIIEAYHELGLTVFAFGAIAMAIAAFPFRKGQRFAWYVSWLVPALWLGYLVSLSYQFSQLGQGPPYVFLIFPLVGVLGQLLPFRKFFPKTQTAAS